MSVRSSTRIKTQVSADHDHDDQDPSMEVEGPEADADPSDNVQDNLEQPELENILHCLVCYESFAHSTAFSFRNQFGSKYCTRMLNKFCRLLQIQDESQMAEGKDKACDIIWDFQFDEYPLPFCTECAQDAIGLVKLQEQLEGLQESVVFAVDEIKSLIHETEVSRKELENEPEKTQNEDEQAYDTTINEMRTRALNDFVPQTKPKRTERRSFKTKDKQICGRELTVKLLKLEQEQEPDSDSESATLFQDKDNSQDTTKDQRFSRKRKRSFKGCSYDQNILKTDDEIENYKNEMDGIEPITVKVEVEPSLISEFCGNEDYHDFTEANSSTYDEQTRTETENADVDTVTVRPAAAKAKESISILQEDNDNDNEEIITADPDWNNEAPDSVEGSDSCDDSQEKIEYDSEDSDDSGEGEKPKKFVQKVQRFLQKSTRLQQLGKKSHKKKSVDGNLIQVSKPKIRLIKTKDGRLFYYNIEILKVDVEGQNKFRCNLCGSTRKELKHLERHIRVAHPNGELSKGFECHLCDKVLNIHSKSRHMSIYHSDKERQTFACLICGKNLKTKRSLIHHEAISHSIGVDNLHHCDICQRPYIVMSTLQHHRLSHMNENEKALALLDPSNKFVGHQCSYCAKSFLTDNAVKTHEMIHTNMAPFVCDVCGWGFRTKSSLSDHMDTHKEAGEREFKFPCNYPGCTKKFGRSRQLVSHSYRHYPDQVKPFKCSDCNSSFVRAADFKVHKRMHTGEKPYTCEVCGKFFSRSYHLTRHRRNIHHIGSETSDIIQE